VFVFSSHNPRAIFVRPAWNQERLRAFAGKLVHERGVLYPVIVSALTSLKWLHSLFRATAESVARICRMASKTAFWRGGGYLFDPAHGGWMTHCGTPDCVRQELGRFNFRQEAFLGDDYPRRSHELVTDWYYYVFRKLEAAEGKSCA